MSELTYICPACQESVSHPEFQEHWAAMHPSKGAGGSGAGSSKSKEARIRILDNQKVYPHQKVMYQELIDILMHPEHGKGCNILDYKCTGCGKTSCLVLYHYALKATRTLIITPSKKTLEEVQKQLDGTADGSRKKFLEHINALSGDYKGPSTRLLTESGSQVKMDKRIITKLMDFDILAATAAKVSNSRAEKRKEKAAPKRKGGKQQPAAEGAAAAEDAGPSTSTAPGTAAKRGGRGKTRNPEELSEWLFALYEASKRMIKEFGKPLFDLIVFDEGHHILARTWQLILDTLGSLEWTDENGVRRKPFVVYCTGTPDRIKEVSDFPLDVKLTPFTLLDAMKKVELPSGRTAGPFVKKIVMLDVAERAKQQASDDEEDSGSESGGGGEESAGNLALQRQMDVMGVMAHLLATKRRGSDVLHRGLVTVRGVNKCDELCAAIEAAQLPLGNGRVMRAAVIHGEMSDAHRHNLLDKFKTHNLEDAIDVLINDTVLGEGFDEAQVSVVAVLKTQKSTAAYAQFVGRGVRLNQAGQDRRIMDKDNVCHIVTHRAYDTLGVFRDFTREAQRQEEVREDLDGEAERVQSEYGEEEADDGQNASGRSKDEAEEQEDEEAASAAKRRRGAAGKGQVALVAASASPIPSPVAGAAAAGDDIKHTVLRRYLFPLPEKEANELRELERATYFKDRVAWEVEDMPDL